MIRAIIHDIGSIIDRLQKQHTYGGIIYHLDADVKYYLHGAFLDGRVDDFLVHISRGPDRIHLKVQVKEDIGADWDYLGFVIDKQDTVPESDPNTAYARAMQGV